MLPVLLLQNFHGKEGKSFHCINYSSHCVRFMCMAASKINNRETNYFFNKIIRFIILILVSQYVDHFGTIHI